MLFYDQTFDLYFRILDIVGEILVLMGVFIPRLLKIHHDTGNV